VKAVERLDSEQEMSYDASSSHLRPAEPGVRDLISSSYENTLTRQIDYLCLHPWYISFLQLPKPFLYLQRATDSLNN
jgi:hypothetical protein